MKKSILLILFVGLIFSTNFYAQKKNTKKEKIEQVKKIKTEGKKEKIDKSEKIQKEKKKTTNKQYQQKKTKKKKPIDFSNFINSKKNPYTETDHNQVKLKKFKKKKHKPFSHTNIVQQIHYQNPIQYHYTISPQYIYRGLWIRFYFIHDDGFFFHDGYPYFVYNNHFHRYSNIDTGSYDLVDSLTDKVFATFYGASSKQSYDRCANLRDRLNNEEGFYRYFCAERFIYDTDYYYDWDPDDYPDWYWY